MRLTEIVHSQKSGVNEALFIARALDISRSDTSLFTEFCSCHQSAMDSSETRVHVFENDLGFISSAVDVNVFCNKNVRMLKKFPHKKVQMTSFLFWRSTNLHDFSSEIVIHFMFDSDEQG